MQIGVNERRLIEIHAVDPGVEVALEKLKMDTRKSPGIGHVR
jgi:hypothetical protein